MLLNVGKSILVSGIPTPLKNMSSSDWIIIPTIGENKKNVPNHQSELMVVNIVVK